MRRTTTRNTATTRATTTTGTTVASRGALLFDDGFDRGRLDATRWNTCYWWAPDGCTISHNDELEWYTAAQVSESAGQLHLTAERTAPFSVDGRTYAYRSGMVTTGRRSEDETPKFAFRYGTVEVRARFPRGSGLWPAIWMLPITNESRPEIDVVEVRGSATDDLAMHLHVRDGQGVERDPGEHVRGPDTADGFHTFGLDWRPGLLRWLVDGTETWRVTGALVPNEPMYLVINLAVGGSWVGPPNAATRFPAVLDVDRVRVWAPA